MRRTWIVAAIWLSWSPFASAQQTAPDAAAGLRVLDTLDPCNAARPADEIVVCGDRLERDRYRIPQLGGSRSSGYVRGEVPRASAEPFASGGCGIFQGQRRCSKAEMAEFGYGGGRDPITFIVGLVTRLTDPDADVGGPPAFPR